MIPAKLKRIANHLAHAKQTSQKKRSILHIQRLSENNYRSSRKEEQGKK